MLEKKIRKIIQEISKSDLVYKLAKRITFDHRGENNADIDCNGELLLLEKNMDMFSCIFDVGANVGDWTNFVLKLNPNAKIYSFEPTDDSFSKLSDNIKSENVHLVKLALGDKNEKVVFNIYGECSVLNSVNNRVGVDLEILRKQEVEVKKIDDYCLENKIDNVDFLKIDVEGNELKVLEGSREMFKEGKIGVVQFEYGGTFIDNGILLKDAFVFFKDLPYTIYKILPSKLLKVVYSQDLENFQYSNYVVINNGIIGKINF